MKRLVVGCVLFLSLLPVKDVVADHAQADPDDAIRARVEAYRHLREGWESLRLAESQVLEAIDLAAPEEDDSLPQKAVRNFRKAIKSAESALQLQPNDLPDACLIAANAYWNLGELRQTDRYYSMALKMDPARDDILSARVGLRVQLKEWARALVDVERLEELRSEFAKSARREYEAASRDE